MRSKNYKIIFKKSHSLKVLQHYKKNPNFIYVFCDLKKNIVQCSITLAPYV